MQRTNTLELPVMAVKQLKRCSKCGQKKELSEFYGKKEAKDGYTSCCKACHKEYQANNKERITKYHKERYINNKEKRREYNKKWNSIPSNNYKQWESCLMRAHGLTSFQLSFYYEILENQHGYCPLCRRHRSESSKEFVLDHNHKTELRRGLICHTCNKILGLIPNENPNTMRRMIKWVYRSI